VTRTAGRRVPEAGILADDVNNPGVSIANRFALAQAKHDIRILRYNMRAQASNGRQSKSNFT
jgi:hypothetical protein